MSGIIERYNGFVEAYRQRHDNRDPGFFKFAKYALKAFFGYSVKTHNAGKHIFKGPGDSNTPAAKGLDSRAVTGMNEHSICRDPSEAPEGYHRVGVPDDKVSWNTPFEDYKPSEYTAVSVLRQPVWADPLKPKDVNWKDKAHQSHLGEIKFDQTGMPLNPKGRTGTEGRGQLGKWGPNHAADPIITRDGPDGTYELLLIKRGDNGQWALPGGMVDPTDASFSAAAIRELAEEALNSPEVLDDDIKSQLALLEGQLKIKGETDKEIEARIIGLRNKLVFEKLKNSPGFQQPEEVYKGYVDDRRNTDNAWMETAAYHTHIEGSNPYLNKPEAGDDAQHAQWVEVTPELVNSLYASHPDIVKHVPRIKEICA